MQLGDVGEAAMKIYDIHLIIILYHIIIILVSYYSHILIILLQYNYIYLMYTSCIFIMSKHR